MSLELTIEVHEPRQRYTSNDPIAGTVVLTVLQETEVDQVLIACQCISEINVMGGSRKLKADHQHYKKEQNRTVKKLMSPGEYRYPFTFTLPSSGLLPETYSSGTVAVRGSRGTKTALGKICWEIKASVRRSKMFEIHLDASHQFWFIPKLVQNNYDSISEHSLPPMPIKPSYRFRRREPVPNIYFSVQLRDSGIQQAPHTAGVSVKLFSDSERLLFVKRLSIYLEATTTFKLKTQSFTDVSLSNIFDISPHLPLGFDPVDLKMCTDKEEFELPTMFYGSMDTPVLCLSYNLVIEAQVGMFADPRFAKKRQVRLPVNVRSLQTATSPLFPRVPPIPNDQLNDSLTSLTSKLSYPRTMHRNFGIDSFIEMSSIASTVSSSGYKITAPASSSPFAMPYEPHLLSKPGLMASPASTVSPDLSSTTMSSSSLYELWQPELEDDIAALIFKPDTQVIERQLEAPPLEF